MSSGKAHIGKLAPDFQATALMPDGQFKELKLSDYRGKYVVLFFYQFAGSQLYEHQLTCCETSFKSDFLVVDLKELERPLRRKLAM